MTNSNIRGGGSGSDSGAGVLDSPPARTNPARTVAICDTQPVTAEGVRTLLNSSAELRFQQSADSLSRALDLMQRQAPDVLLLDKAFGIQAILEWLTEARATSSQTGS
jgi:DNA-binding NarL/FixJ family response regulator